MPDGPMPGLVGSMLSPYDMGGLPMRDVGLSQPVPIGTLASALANATPEHQRMVMLIFNILFQSSGTSKLSCVLMYFD